MKSLGQTAKEANVKNKNVDACECMEHGEKECLDAKALRESEYRLIEAQDTLETTLKKRDQAFKDLDKPSHTPDHIGDINEMVQHTPEYCDPDNFDAYKTQDGKWHINIPSDGVLDYVGANAEKHVRNVVKCVNAHEELISLARRVCFPNGGRDYTDAKEALTELILKMEGKE